LSAAGLETRGFKGPQTRKFVETIEIAPMRVVITGAAGKIGSELIAELLDRHDLCLIDLRSVNGRPSIICDLSRIPDGQRSPAEAKLWPEAFEGADVVVHLAAEIDPEAPWQSVLPNNVQATWNVIQTAARYAVPRIVFASSNWTVKALERRLAPRCYLPDGPKITSDTPPCPLTAYGLSKALGELSGRVFVDEGRLSSFVAVRIGNHYPPFSTAESQGLWIGVGDIRSLLRRCVEAEFTGFHIVYGVSAQRTAPYDLSHTRRLLSWDPRQSVIDLRPRPSP
jgi:NAD+ dependent glucose-6-phosphate dehydrogenase